MKEVSLDKGIKFLVVIVLSVVVVYYGKPFLVPVVFAALLSMLLLPLSERLMSRGWNKVLSILFCILVFLAAIGIIIAVLSWQISDIAKDAPRIEENISKAIEKLRQTISTRLGIPIESPKQQLQNQTSQGNTSGFVTGILSWIGGFLAHFVLVLVYIFLFLFYRTRLKNFVLKLVPEKEEANARAIIDDSRKVAQKYLSGLALMIACLWIMYSIGFTIVGIENPVFFAILCGTMEIVPFVGNLVGSLLTAGFTVAQGGGFSMVVGVLITYGIVQFLQTYLLEPLVVGRGVNINPLFTIAGLVAGEIIWGIPGMVLAIPLLGITKIICDHIEPLKPYGLLIGDHTGGKKQANPFQRIFSRKK